VVHPGKCRDSNYIIPRPLPSKFFPIHYSPIKSTGEAAYIEISTGLHIDINYTGPVSISLI
jgi:hypothetical protein